MKTSVPARMMPDGRKHTTANFRRRTALAGIVAPILFTALVAVESLLRPGYSQVANYVSELGVGPFAAIQNANFLVFGLLAWAFAFGLEANLPTDGGRAKKYAVTSVIVSSVAIIVAGIALVLWGAFPDDYTYLMVHNIASFVVFFAFVAVQLLTWRTLRGRDVGALGRYPTYSLASGVVTLVLVFVLIFTLGAAYHGATERLLIAVPFVWLVVTGKKFYSLNAAATPSDAAN